MSKPKAFDVDALWALDRIGEPSLSPDGAQAVAGVTRHSMEHNKAQSSLWLFSTLGGEPRRLTEAGEKDGNPQWSPRGDLIAFTAKREQAGQRDEEAQLYVIAPDGGEARRVGHGRQRPRALARRPCTSTPSFGLEGRASNPCRDWKNVSEKVSLGWALTKTCTPWALGASAATP